MDVTGRVALITGGSRGFGRAFGEALLELGANVVLLDVLVQQGVDTALELNTKYGPGRVTFMTCDVSNSAELQSCFEKAHSIYGFIDIVVNNAGLGIATSDRVMVDVNVTGVIEGCNLARKYMNPKNGGRGGVIVNIASIGGIQRMAVSPTYAATKAAVLHYSRSLALFCHTNSHLSIRVVCLCPSFAKTNIYVDTLKLAIDDEDQARVQKEAKEGSIAMGIMEVDQVVDAFMFCVREGVQGAVVTVTPKGKQYHFPRKLRESRL